MSTSKIGIGLITCNSESRFLQSAHLIPKEMGELVIVNDGLPYPSHVYPTHAFLIQHDRNYSVAKSKNDALKYLMNKGCTHFFLIEDDVIIRDTKVFDAYIQTARISGIYHLNYALQGPHNRKQVREVTHKERNAFEKFVNRLFRRKILLSKKKRLTADERKLLSETGPPSPKYIKKYDNGLGVALYQNCVGAFSYYHKSVLEDIGLMDENFINAWEHVHHTYQATKKGYHPPFWWFADIFNSESYLDNVADCMQSSVIANSSAWRDNIEIGEAHFVALEGVRPGDIPNCGLEKVKDWLDRAETGVHTIL